MALSNRVQHPRCTLSSLNTLAAGNGLLAGECYLLTDQNRIAFALTTSTYQLFERVSNSTLVFVIDGGGVALTAGKTVDLPDIPYNCTVLGWTMVGDVSGSAVATISHSTYANFPTFTAISGTEKPTLASAQKNQDLSLTTWTTSLTQGDILRASLDSASTVTRLEIGLRVIRT